MIAGLVLISAVVGLLAVAGTVVASAPLWVTLLTYPAVCSLTLLLTAALWNIRAVQLRQNDQLLHIQS